MLQFETCSIRRCSQDQVVCQRRAYLEGRLLGNTKCRKRQGINRWLIHIKKYIKIIFNASLKKKKCWFYFSLGLKYWYKAGVSKSRTRKGHMFWGLMLGGPTVKWAELPFLTVYVCFYAFMIWSRPIKLLPRSLWVCYFWPFSSYLQRFFIIHIWYVLGLLLTIYGHFLSILTQI